MGLSLNCSLGLSPSLSLRLSLSLSLSLTLSLSLSLSLFLSPNLAPTFTLISTLDVSGTRDVLLAYAAEGQPEPARKMALRALGSLADDESNREPMWPVCRYGGRYRATTAA